MKRKIDLQHFADGGAGAGASADNAAGEVGGAATTGVNGDSPVSQGDLSQVVYGKTDPNLAQSDNGATAANSTEDRAKLFENMVKKGGEYHDQFNEYTQKILNKRFKETKGLEEKVQSYNPIMETLAAKYGVDAKDIEGISKALDADTSMFEEAAFKEGLTPEQYRNKLALERENARLKAAEDARIAEAQSEQIYSQWLQDAEALGQKYGREIDLAAECENKEFTDLLAAGVQFEVAYKAIHMDEMLNGAMAFTASKVQEALVNKAASYSNRPVENAGLSSSSQVFKSDVNKFTDADLKEIRRRVEENGERIVL